MSRTVAGTLLALSAACGYALLPIFARLAYRAGLEPMDVLTWRFILAASGLALLGPLWWRWANLRSLRRADALALLGLGALFAFVALMAFIGLANVPAPIFSPIFYTYPAMTALLAAALGEKLPGSAWLAVTLAVAGCAVSAASADIAAFNPLNLIYPLITAASYAVYLTIVGKRTSHISGLASAVMGIFGSLIILLIAAGGIKLALGLGMTGIKDIQWPASPQAWLPVAGIALFSTVFTIMAMFMGIARIGPARAAILSTIEPVVVIILSAIILQETIGQIQIVGGALILASVALLNIPAHANAAELAVELEQPQ